MLSGEGGCQCQPATRYWANQLGVTHLQVVGPKLLLQEYHAPGERHVEWRRWLPGPACYLPLGQLAWRNTPPGSRNLQYHSKTLRNSKNN
jgi:hypothetical protein